MDHNKKAHLATISALSAVCIASGTWASEQITSLDPIVVYSFNNDQFAEDADRNMSIYVSRDSIEAAETGNLRDVFADHASVTVGGAMPIAQKVFVNGVDALNLNMTIEGAMQNNRAFHHVTANAIDPALLRAVRVDAGIAAADSGPNALGGSVAFQVIDALDLLREGETLGGKVGLSFDNNSETFTQSLTGFGVAEGFDLLAFAKNAKGQNYETGDDETITGTGANLQAGLIKAGYTSASGHRIEATGLVLKDKEKRQKRANFGGLGGAQQALRTYDTLRKTFSMRYEHMDPSDLFDPEIVLGFSENQIDAAKIEGDPKTANSEGTSNTFNGKLANTFHVREDLRFTTGMDFYRKRSRYDDEGSHLEERSSNIGAFGQLRWDATSALQMSVGGRFDHQNFEGTNDFSKKVSGFSGNSSVAYEVIEGLKLKAGVATVFGGIPLEDNYTFNPGWDYSKLKSTRSNNVTAGFEFERSGFSFSGEVFQTNIQRARSIVPGSVELTNMDIVTKGFNLAAGYGWGNGRAKLTYSNTEVEVEGNAASSYAAQDFAAPLGQVIAFTASHRLDEYNLTVGGNIQGAFEYKTGSGESDRLLKGYAAVGLFAEYEPEQIDGLKLRLEANNLFDADYADRGTYGSDFSDVQTLKEPGRSFKIAGSYRF